MFGKTHPGCWSLSGRNDERLPCWADVSVNLVSSSQHLIKSVLKTPAKVRQALIETEQPVPETDLWRVPLLEKLLVQRRQLEVNTEDTKAVSELIDSPCSS